MRRARDSVGGGHETVNDTLAERADASDAADGAEGAQEVKERNCLLSFVCVCSRPSSFREGVTMIVTTKIPLP